MCRLCARVGTGGRQCPMSSLATLFPEAGSLTDVASLVAVYSRVTLWLLSILLVGTGTQALALVFVLQVFYPQPSPQRQFPTFQTRTISDNSKYLMGMCM